MAPAMAQQPPTVAHDRDLSVQSLQKSFGKFRAIDDLCLDIRQGEFLTLLGPSGSGKTTLLMMIAGFLAPDSGALRLGARDITADPPEDRNFGMVFQGYALFPHLSVRDNVAFPLKVRKVPAAEIERRVAEALDLVQLGPLADRLPKQLSGGQQQRVALARAMVFTPHLLLLDEPLSALDKKLRAEMQEELKRLHRKVGLTFIYVTHDQEEALSMSDRIVVMKDGRIRQQGAPRDLYRHPRDSFVASFLGRSNFLHAPMRDEGEMLVAETAEGPVRQRRRPGDPTAAEGAVIGIRPEAITLAVPGQALDNLIAAKVQECSYFGSSFQLTVATAAFGLIEVEMPASRAPDGLAPGEAVTLGWNADDGMVVTEQPPPA